MWPGAFGKLQLLSRGANGRSHTSFLITVLPSKTDIVALTSLCDDIVDWLQTTALSIWWYKTGSNEEECWKRPKAACSVIKNFYIIKCHMSNSLCLILSCSSAGPMFHIELRRNDLLIFQCFTFFNLGWNKSGLTKCHFWKGSEAALFKSKELFQRNPFFSRNFSKTTNFIHTFL